MTTDTLIDFLIHLWPITLLPIAVIVPIMIPRTNGHSFKAPQGYPYKKRNLLTKNEYPFFMQLRDACEDEKLYLLTKVRLEDLCYTTSKSHTRKYRGYINSRHVDFVICDKKMNVLAAVELDDPSHNAKESKKTDAFKDNLFKTIGIPLYRIKTNGKNKYKQDIKELLAIIQK